MLRTTLLALSLSTSFAAPYKKVADNETTWMLGGAGQNCSFACHSQAMRCTEKAWPTSQSNFQQEVLNTIPNNGGCNKIKNVGDDMESDPQKQGDTCWWDADPADRYRCNEIPSSDHQRFCPCVGITPPPPPPAHCPPAEAACAADQNCNAFGVFNNNYQLHGCSDALVPNNDWTVYVLSNTSEWQVLARDSNVDESQCKVHPTGVISGTCSPPAPPTAHCPPAEAACAADQNCHAIGLTPIGVDDNTYQLHGCSDSLLPNNDWTVYVLSSNTSEWQVLARHINVDESGCKVHPTGVISGTCSDPTPPAPPPTPPAPPQCYAAGQCLPAGSDKKDGKTLCCNKKHAKKDENCAHGKRHGKKGFACALSTAPRGRAFEILQQ